MLRHILKQYQDFWFCMSFCSEFSKTVLKDHVWQGKVTLLYEVNKMMWHFYIIKMSKEIQPDLTQLLEP